MRSPSSLHFAAIVTATTVLAQLGIAQATPPQPLPTVIRFNKDRPGQPPAGFSFGRTGSGALGKWIVKAEKDAPSEPNVLAQTDADNTDYRFPVAAVNQPLMENGQASVRCKPFSGKVDQACGLVFRYRDENNYYVARANALESNTRLYLVKDGKRRQVASHSGKVARGAWHEIAAEIDGAHIQVFFDGKKIIDAHDKTFPSAGKVGVWTKADSVTYFDDLTIRPR